jgi:DNA gyrase subunit A
VFTRPRLESKPRLPEKALLDKISAMRTESVDISKQLKEDFLSYSTAIFNRSLPDVVDGLKTAQRRVLLGLQDLNLVPTSSYSKVTRLEGHALGTYHPQGGCAGTIINLGQHSAQRYPLTDIHGNVGGSIQTGDSAGQLVSDDGPAAARYLEVRATPLCKTAYLDEIRNGVGEWRPNYDGTRTEPVRIVPVLPMLLLTGAQGITPGYSCSHIPFYLDDVINATISLIKTPGIRDSTFLSRFSHPPEPPQGGRIEKNTGLQDVILQGKGSITAYGNWAVEDGIKWGKRSKRPGIVVTRLAYGSSESFTHRVRELFDGDKLPGLLDVADHSSRDGIRVVLVFKSAPERDYALGILIKSTGLRYTHNVACVAVGVDGKPVTTSAKDTIREWYKARVNYLTEVYTKETEVIKTKLGRLQALVAVLSDLDKFINIVRKAKSKEDAIAKVEKTWKLSNELSRYVISVPISNLIGTETKIVKEDCARLQSQVDELERLSHPGADLDAHICAQIASLRGLGAPARSVWMMDRVADTPSTTKSEPTRKDRMREEASQLGISTRTFNKWLRESLSEGGDVETKWQEFKKHGKINPLKSPQHDKTQPVSRKPRSSSARSSKTSVGKRTERSAGKERRGSNRSTSTKTS